MAGVNAAGGSALSPEVLDSRVRAWQPVNLADSQFHAHLDGATADNAALAAAFAAADARGPGAFVQLPPVPVIIDGTFPLSGYHSSLRGVGHSNNNTHATGSGLKAINQTGPVLDFTGWLAPVSNQGVTNFGNFFIEGDGAAGSAKKGIYLNTVSGLVLRDVAIYKCGGIPLDLYRLYLCLIDNIVLNTPVSAFANDIPYFRNLGANCNTFSNFLLRSIVASADVGPSGAAVTDIFGGASSQPESNLHLAWRYEFLHTSDGAALFSMKGIENVMSDFQFVDCSKDSGATNTCHFRLGAPSVGNSGGNIVRGVIPGRDTGAASIDYGVDVLQSWNRVEGVKGYRGNNVRIASGVLSTCVRLGGSVGACSDAAVEDNSGSLTQDIEDAYLNLKIIKGTKTSAPATGAFRIEDPANAGAGILQLGTLGSSITSILTTGQMYYSVPAASNQVHNFRQGIAAANVQICTGGGNPALVATAQDATHAAVRTIGGFIEVNASGGPKILAGAGTPEAAITAPIGSLYLRTDGGAGTSHYVKESGAGNTGWVAK